MRRMWDLVARIALPQFCVLDGASKASQGRAVISPALGTGTRMRPPRKYIQEQSRLLCAAVAI
jgi:hypothetical protein